MNKKMLTITAVAALVGGSASYAAQISKDVKSQEKEWSEESVSAHPRMGSSVKKFVDAQKKNTAKRKVTLKTDPLGRRGGALKGALNYEINAADVQKMKVVVSDVKVNDAPMPTVHGRCEYSPSLDQKAYWLNGSKVDESKFIDQADKRKAKYDLAKNSFKSPRVAYLTASEIEKELSSSETRYVSEYREPKPQVSYGLDVYWDYQDILKKSGVTDYAHNNSVKGQGVGVYYNEGGCVPDNYVNSDYFVQVDYPCHGYSTHAIGVARILQTTAPEAKIYSIQDVTYPENVTSYAQPILIGSQSWGFVYDPDPKTYTDGDAVMDNFIFENRVVEFVAAGNDGRKNIVGSPGRAFNAISVGAISPADDKYVYYSSSLNPLSKNDKPEVANYTHFIFPDPTYEDYNGYFSGTSAATPFMAGMTANLLSQHRFLWWHPEVVKAVLMAGSNPVQNPDYDIDGTLDFEAGIPNYSNFSWNDAYRWSFWEGENDAVFDANREISFTEYTIQKGKRYRIAISWLTSGEYALQHQKIAQDIDLSVWQDGKRVAISNSLYNPFELVEFVAPSSSPLTIKIKRYYNFSTTEKVVLGYAFVSKD